MRWIVVGERCILITGTIVQNVVKTIPEDPKTRRQAYLDNLKYYSDILDDPIIFLENSTYSFDNDFGFKDLFSDKNIKLIKFPVSRGVSQGKGFQEFEMLDKAVEQLSGVYSSFVKISGRYRYLNITEIIDYSNGDLTIDLLRRKHEAVTSIFYVTFDFYKDYLLNVYHEVDDINGDSIEQIIYKLVMNENLLDNIRFFRVHPMVNIFTQNSEQKTNKHLSSLKISASNIERKILRFLSVNELYH